MKTLLIIIVTILILGGIAWGVWMAIGQGERGGELNPFGPPLYTLESFRVENLHENSMTLYVSSGEVIEGDFTIRGNGCEVKFWIKDPHGTTVHNAGMVHNHYSFYVRANASGYYTLYWDNSFSWTVDKDISLRIRHY